MAGKSFSGPSGKVLDHLLQLHGTSRDEVIATNVVLCQSDGTESGFAFAQACCEPRLEAEIAEVTTVIAAGREAAKAVTGDPNVARNRGYVHYRDSPMSDKTQRVIVTNNPAVVLRDDGNFPELVRDFRLAINPLPQPEMPMVRWTEKLDEARDWARQIYDQLSVKAGSFYSDDERLVSCDIEGFYTGMTAVGFSTRPERAVVFGVPVVQDEDFRQEFLEPLLTIEGLRYLWHNGKYDVKVLRHFDIAARVDEDSMLLSWCLDERPGDPESGAGGHSLEWLLKDELGWPKYEPASVRHYKRTGELPDLRSRIDLYEYNGKDCAGTRALFPVLKERAINDSVWDRPYKSLLIRLSEALSRVEAQGIIYDAEQACDILEGEVWPTLKEWRHSMQEISGDPKLNPNSPKQLELLLYESWGITHNLKRPRIENQGKRSTDKSVREKILRDDYRSTRNVDREAIGQFISLLDKFKELDKQRGTYLEGMVLRRGKDGRIYTDFKIHGTESGRLSSSRPNLQNITRTKEGLPNIRRTFVPDSGCVFLSADLSQAELRTIAVLSGDDELKAIYTDTGRSLHREVASQFYGENYTYEQYVRAKNINFGVAYWQSAFSFAQMYYMPQSEAQEYIDFWWSRFPKVYEWTKEMEQRVMTEGEIQSPFGHKRRFYVIPADEGGRLHVVKQGINFLPQNIAANITLWALCNIAEKLDWRIAQPRITVHDNIVVNCRESHVDEVAHLIKSEMENTPLEAIEWDFPYVADLSVGYDWGTLNDYEQIAA
jgi:DNA polymerase-1